MSLIRDTAVEASPQVKPWAAVWSMLIGFFMLMIDALIVAVANPTIQDKLSASLSDTMWVTSAYLLCVAVPLLVAGRLGDRFGQRNVFLVGMVVFTLASLVCGLSTNIGLLILGRAIQGIGGALMMPQSSAIVVRLFPPERRGAPMGMWGAVSGLGILVAPLLGGVLVDHVGWEAIFLINVPVGMVGIILVAINVPKLPVSRPRFDWVGTALSGLGVFLIVFGIQEGSVNNWGTVFGGVTIWEVILTGVIVMIGFVLWEVRGAEHPLIPIRLFRHRDFSVSTLAITCAGFVVTTFPVPALYYLQMARANTATQAALYTLPMALISCALSPLVGARLLPRFGARACSTFGMLVWAAGVVWFIMVMDPSTPLVPWALFPAAVIGVGNSFVWTPLATTATRELPSQDAGAGTAIYNMTRQLGSVIGAASISALMTDRIGANLTEAIASLPAAARSALHLTADRDPSAWLATATDAEKAWFSEHFSPAMAQSLWLPVAVVVAGAVVTLFYSRHRTAAPHS
jgi:EmrB/QacA subfamily drug resistance transporter